MTTQLQHRTQHSGVSFASWVRPASLRDVLGLGPRADSWLVQCEDLPALHPAAGLWFRAYYVGGWLNARDRRALPYCLAVTTGRRHEL
jgi:hypothetical protein